jgi:hypothetical protein
MGLYHTQILNITTQFNCRLSRHTPQWTDLMQPYNSTCFTGDSFNRTVSDRLHHTTKDHALKQSTSLPANNGPQDRTSQRSVFLASTDPTALEAKFYQSHHLTRFTGGPSSRTVSCTLTLSTAGPFARPTESIVRSTFSWDYLLSIAACILNGQSPRCYSQYENIVCSVGMRCNKGKLLRSTFI